MPHICLQSICIYRCIMDEKTKYEQEPVWGCEENSLNVTRHSVASYCSAHSATSFTIKENDDAYMPSPTHGTKPLVSDHLEK